MTGATWQAVCGLDDLEVGRGVAALVHGQAVAIFRTDRDEVHALANQDPGNRSSVLARGILGRRGGVDFVALPLNRHSFDLTTGHCREDPTIQVAVFEVRVVDGVVEIGPRKARVPAPSSVRRARRGAAAARRPELSRWPPRPRRAP